MYMEKSKPLSIIFKKDINTIGNELILIRRAFKEENDSLGLNDTQLLRLILLGCLHINMCDFVGMRSNLYLSKSLNAIFDNVESMLGNGFVEEYVGLSYDKVSQISCISAAQHFETIVRIPMWKKLLPYAFEILEYSEQELEQASKDRRSGIITKKKKQSGVYYTPMDVVKYMVNGCLDKLEHRQISLMNCYYVDYSCGSGVFLLQLLDSIIERNLITCYEDYYTFVLSSLFGVDISEYAVECCRYMILQHCINHFYKCGINFRLPLLALRKNIIVADATDMDAYYRYHSSFPKQFGCIIGNPPYVGTSNPEQQSIKSNLFIPFVYNLQKYSSKKSVCALVLPLAFSYNNQLGFREMRKSIEEDYAEWQIEHYDRSPDSLFGDDVKARACIVFRISGETHKVCSTGLMRWTSTSREHLLTTPKKLIDITEFSIVEFVPKLACRLEKVVYAKILKQPNTLLDILQTQSFFSENCIAVKGTAYNWICAYDHLPPAFNADGTPYVSKDLKLFSTNNEEERYFVLAYLNSRIAFWLWTIVGDGFHVTNRLMSIIRFSKDTFVYNKLVLLGKAFSKLLIQYPTISINSGKTITSYDHNKLMDIVEQIDIAIIEALSIDQSFIIHLRQWYFDIVTCGRQNMKESDDNNWRK